MSRKYRDMGKYHEEKSRLPDPDGLHCIICGRELPKRRRKYCSDACFSSWFKSAARDWNILREDVLKRDKNECQNCGSKDSLVVHHVVPVAWGGREFKESNCITLCHRCHMAAHSNTNALKKALRNSQSTLLGVNKMKGGRDGN